MKLKKLLAGFMAACMLVTAVPVAAMAEDATADKVCEVENCETEHVAAIGEKEYHSIQEAVDSASDGDTVKVIADHKIEYKDAVKNSGGYSTLVNVARKNVTVDLNGKVISVTGDQEKVEGFQGKMLLAVFSVDTDGVLTLTDSSNDKGEVNVIANETNVYSVVTNYNDKATLYIKGGRYIVDAVSSYSMIYSGEGDMSASISGGYFELGNPYSKEQQGALYPWIFNTSGNGVNKISVIGGTYNISPQNRWGEAYIPLDKAIVQKVDGKWTIANAVSYVYEKIDDNNKHRDVGHATLAEAVAAAANETHKTVTLLKDFALKDFSNLSDLDKVTFNGNGKAITVDGDSASVEKAIKVDGKLFFDGGNATIADLNDIFDIATGAKFYIVGGIYGFEPSEYLPKGYAAVANEDNTLFTVGVGDLSDFEAKVGKEYFKTLEEAIAAANALEGKVIIELLKNVELDETLKITGNVAIEGNGNEIISAENKEVDPLLEVSEDSKLTLEGVTVTGNVEVSGSKLVDDKKVPAGELIVEGNATIGGDVTVGEEGKVTNNGEIKGDVTVTDGEVTNNGEIKGNVVAKKDSKVTNEGEIDGDVTIEDGIVVNNGTMDNVEISGGNLVNNETITGDVTVSGDGEVKNNDTIKGNVIVSGGSMENNGTIEESVEVSGGSMENNDTIEGDVSVSGGNMTNEGEINGSVNVTDGAMTNNDTIKGNVIVSGEGELENKGEIEGNVVVPELSEEESVGGTVGGNVIEVIEGTVTEIEDGEIIIEGPANVKVDGTEIEVPAPAEGQEGNEMVINPDGSVKINQGNEIIIKGEGETETTVTVPKGYDSISVPGDKLEDVEADANGNLTTLPEGSKIEIGDTEITVGDGEGNDDTATINPETGEITLPEGSTIKDKESNKETILPNGGTVNNEGEISTDEAEAGNTTVTGDVTVNPNGSVDVPAGGSVNVNGEEIEIVEGEVTVNPDGTVTVPEGSTIKQENGNVIEAVTGGVTVDEDGNVIIPPGGVVNVNGKPVTFPDGGTIGTDGTISEGIVAPDTSNSGNKSSKKYDVSVDTKNIKNGSVKLSPSKAKKGTTVTLTVTPDAGYELEKLVVLDKDGNKVELTDKGDGKFTFKMPRGGVEVDAEFVEADAAGKSEIVLTIGSNIVMVDGEPVVNDVAPIIRGERTFLPIRLIAEALGATVAWNEADQSVAIVKDGLEIVIYIGQAFALVNGDPVALDEAAFIENSRTYLPLRFIVENLGAAVTWDGVSKTVTVVG